jgi:hypothetical protein
MPDMKQRTPFAAIILLTLWTWWPADAQHADLHLRIGLSRHDFLVGEPVFATVSLVNDGDSAVEVHRLYLPYEYIKIIVKNSKGKVFPLNYGKTTARDSMRSVRLQPHDSETVTVDLLPLYAPGDKTARKLHTKTFFSPGLYTVQARFDTRSRRIASTPVSFRVRNPAGAERTAHDLLVRAGKLQLDHQEALAASALDTIILRYPVSAYHVQAFLQKMYLYEYSEAVEEQQIACGAALSLIDAHPESDAAIPALSYFLIHSDQIGKTTTDVRETLMSIAQKHPGTRIGRQAEKALKSYRAGG